MREGQAEVDIEALIREALREVLDEQLERLLEVVLKEVGGLSAQILGLQGGLGSLADAGRNTGTGADLAELILSASARGGRFL